MCVWGCPGVGGGRVSGREDVEGRGGADTPAHPGYTVNNIK